MTEARPTDELRREHEKGVTAMRRLWEHCRDRPPVAHPTWAGHIASVGAALSELRSLLGMHFRKEEEGLFPDVRRMVSEGAPAVDIIASFFQDQSDEDLKAHSLLRSRMAEMADLAARLQSREGHCEEAAKELEAKAAFTCDLLERHAGKENTAVFPLIERLLDKSQMSAVAERMQAIQASCAVMLSDE